MLVLAGGVVLADQASKDWALGHLKTNVPRHVLGPANLVLVFNKGAAFNLGTGVYPLVVAAVVVLVAAVLVFSRRAASNGVSLPVAIGLGLLSGGAVSNLADRFVRQHHGAVVDFVQAVSWWPTFNLADAAVTVGVVVIAAATLVAGSRGPHDGTEPSGGSPEH
jgi:signal peptidase II